jgi:hypothetical protein
MSLAHSSEETVERPSLNTLLKDKTAAENFIQLLQEKLTSTGWMDWFLTEMNRESQTDPDLAYPSQGLVRTLHDGEKINRAEVHETDNQEFTAEMVPVMLYYLELFNHPDRIEALLTTPEFQPPTKHFKMLFLVARILNQAISINQLALSPQGDEEPRTRRTDSFISGPFVQLGNQPRTLLVGSANPECWGSAPAIAHMAEAHSLVGVPRDGLFSDIQRQVDLAKKSFEWIENSPTLLGRSSEEKATLVELWKHNVMGVLEANPQKALPRAKRLYKAGVRTFRIYSPEPGSELVETLKALRQCERENNWEPIEIFVGQIVSVQQAKRAEKAGATGIYVGIGGGGRCKTGVRSGVAIDWPELVWKLRGKIKIPIIIEGGASDYIGQTLVTGGTGIGVTRAVAGGTYESPGGRLFYAGDDGQLFKPYGGEASGRVKALGDKEGPFGIIPYEEGDTTTAQQNFGRGNSPTLLRNLYLKNGDIIMAMVFQNARTISLLQEKGVRTLKTASLEEQQLRHPHESM